MTAPGFYRVNDRDYIVDNNGRWRSAEPGSVGLLLVASLDGRPAIPLQLVPTDTGAEA